MKLFSRAALALVAFCLILITGCLAHQASHVAAALQPKHSFLPAGPGTTPPELKSVSNWLEFFVIAGVLALAAAVAVYFCVPEAHKLSFGVAGGAGSLVATSLILRESLWAIPWISRGIILLLLVAVGLFIYEIYANVKAKKPPTAAAAIGDIPGAVKQSFSAFESMGTSI